MDLVYKGKSNQPWDGANRAYETCEVYSSGHVLIEQYDVINDGYLAEYASNPHNEGLFIKIKGTNDPNDTNKVPFGSSIRLNLYIQSSNKNFTQTFSGLMPTHPDEMGGDTATLFIGIDNNYLKGVFGYTNGDDGKIALDYQIGNDADIDVIYGGVWNGYISTEPFA
ncbi:hypothetical protein HZS38_15615 [Xenorhabdus nematophila]|uniref:hypothetical protein n=1 Tax=Xenorhabdus nematophila TaxID=628 RepID=UPI000543835E|nr:hypothetical protein [Xenorhabdus nematophila]CEF31253.1 conserved hypothetical protein [Xenorhabdus nematophila str. Websteri]AYA41761.1 hypothetical protein D3790_16095 [Xenorhabdus nematophila]KHD27346.1 hypothetical protein LH67_18985 [Xenorhabdus nematophila]MBA0020496.1 hypothetical protein [Xenorhabdus nematophila]MCB4427030.1 hypothetical protein [Xenorhabdus nematophila]